MCQSVTLWCWATHMTVRHAHDHLPLGVVARVRKFNLRANTRQQSVAALSSKPCPETHRAHGWVVGAALVPARLVQRVCSPATQPRPPALPCHRLSSESAVSS
jgi:hypothetical protein